MAVTIQDSKNVRKLQVVSEGDTFMFKGEVWVKTSMYNPYPNYTKNVMCIKLAEGFCASSHIHYLEPNTLVIPVSIVDIVVERK